MAKKSTKKKGKKVEVNSESTVDVIGTPTAILLPARNYKFKVHPEMHNIELPREGNYTDLDNKLFKDKDGEFNFLHYSEEDASYTIFVPTLSKVLFGTNKYPDMGDTEAFAPITITIKGDEVEVLGHLIEMVQEK